MNDIKHFQPQFAFKILACLNSGKPLISKVQKSDTLTKCCDTVTNLLSQCDNIM